MKEIDGCPRGCGTKILRQMEARVKELEEEIEALKLQLKEQDEAALRTLEIERDEKLIWKKRAKRGEQG